MSRRADRHALIDGLSLRLADVFPDFRLATALGMSGCRQEIPAADCAALRAAGAQRLKAAAAAVLGVDPELGGETQAERLARRAVAQLARRVGLARVEAAATLEMDARRQGGSSVVRCRPQC